jgi:transcriptional regulator with XRE-family HTH domain
MSELGQILKDIRKEHGLSIINVSLDTGIIRETIYRYEIGKSAPWAKLERLLDYYGYEIEIFRKEDHHLNTDNEEFE